MSDKSLIDAYEKQFLEFRGIARESREATSARLVWFVGIAGFALLNAKPYWEALAGRQIVGITLFWLSLPWVISALLSAMTHFAVGALGVKDDACHASKLATIALLKNAIEDGEEYDRGDLLKLIEDIHPDYQVSKHTVEQWSSIANKLEFSAFVSLVIGFLWAVIGPLIL